MTRRSKPVFKLLLAFCGALCATFLSGCRFKVDTPQSVLDPAGPVARMQLHLLSISVFVMSGIFVVVMVVLVVAILKFRARRGDMSAGRDNPGVTWMEVTWTVIPILILAYLAYPSLKDTFVLASPPPHAMHVTVIGHQFWWEFDYTDGPAKGVKTANELHVPAGTPIEMVVTSGDVVHSFWVPRLAGKVDSIPGRKNHIWMEADKPGMYSGQCSQLCGASHALMYFAVYADSPGDFAQWAAAMKKPFVPPTAAQAKAGQQVFANNCASCHAISGSDYAGNIGPNLSHLMMRHTIAARTLANTPANLTKWVTDAPKIKPGVAMPPALAGLKATSVRGPSSLGLSKQQIASVVAFLETLH